MICVLQSQDRTKRNMGAHIRKATPDDAKAVAGVLNSVIHERQGMFQIFQKMT